MASGSGDITPAGSAGGNDEEAGKGTVSFEGEGKNESKKKKFKPLEKMMRFFKSGKKSSKSKDRVGASGISIKAKSTGALHQEVVSEDEDDGGFSKRLPMGGSRSISEDSVFNPEQRDLLLGVGGIRKTAVSMENIKQDFRSELFTKLQRRRALSSDDEVDDNNSFYLYSSSPSGYNAADIVLGRPKPLPAAGKSNSEDSDISFGGSDNDTEELFKSQWQDAVGNSANYYPKSGNQPADGSMEMDFSAVKLETKTLVNEGAKHRISVKPKARRASSLHHRGTLQRPSVAKATLPQLKEESPVKEIPPSPEVKPTTPQIEAFKTPEPSEPVPDESKDKVPEPEAKTDTDVVVVVKDNRTSIQITAPPSPPVLEDKPAADSVTDASKRRSMIEEQRGIAVLPTSPDALQGVKLRRQRPKSLIEHPKDSSPSGSEANELAKAFQKRLSVRKERNDEDIPIESFKEPKKDMVDITSKISPTESVTSTPSTSQKPSSGLSYVLKKEPLRKVSAPETSNINSRTAILRSVSEESSGTTGEEKKKVNISKMKESEVVTEEKTSLSVQEKSKSLSNKLAAPREEYRLKRQARSKTLPEQPVSREILDAKMSTNTATTTNSVNKFGRGLSVNKPESPAKAAESSGTTENKADPTVSPVSRRTEPKRLSYKGPSVGSSSSTEPSWIAMARKKQTDKEESKDTKEAVKKEPVSAKSSSGSEGTAKSSATTESTKTPAKDSSPAIRVPSVSSNSSKSLNTGSSVKFSGTSSKEEKEKINGNKKGPETVKKEPEPVQRSLSTRTKSFDSKNSDKISSTSTPSSSVPQWKKDLAKKREQPQVKIEIIEKEKPVTTPKPVPPKKPTKALDENSKVNLREKTVPEKCGETASDRKSKVLDIVKNFQKLQVS